MLSAPDDVLEVAARGLRHPVLAWGAPVAPERTIVLLHGFMDAARTFGDVARALAGAGLRVLAPELRGFGEGARPGAGAYYHFPDYVRDVDDVVSALVPEGAFGLVGHSMGGTAATLYAGARPERVARLALLEGAGPADNAADLGPTRMRRWLDGLRVDALGGGVAGGAERALPRGEALTRLRANHARVPAERLAQVLPALVEDAPDAGPDAVRWRFDPLHRTTSPMPFFAEVYKAFARAVTAPVLFVDGGPAGFHPPDEVARLAAFANLECVTLPDAGHMMHWTAPGALARELAAFFAPPASRG